jgi:hypothetical protein
VATNSSVNQKRDDGGPAFPTPFSNQGDLNVCAPTGEVVPPGGWLPLPGMTLRDYFAAQAMNGIVAIEYSRSWNGGPTISDEQLALRCYILADAMLAERSR